MESPSKKRRRTYHYNTSVNSKQMPIIKKSKPEQMLTTDSLDQRQRLNRPKYKRPRSVNFLSHCNKCKEKLDVYACSMRKSGKKYRCNNKTCTQGDMNAPAAAKITKTRKIRLVTNWDDVTMNIATCSGNWETAQHRSHFNFGKKGLADYFPDSNSLVTLVSLIQFGILLDFRFLGCYHCKKKKCNLMVAENQTYGYLWYCVLCKNKWTVTAGSIFYCCAVGKLKTMAQMIYKILLTERTNTTIAQEMNKNRKTVGSLFRKMRRIAMKWNIVHPPDMEGYFEFDELILMKSAKSKVLSNDKRDLKRLTRVWGLNLYNVTTGQVAIGVTECRNSNTIGLFVLNHIPDKSKTDNEQVLSTDSWKGTSYNDFNNITGYNIKHKTVNHSKEWKNKEGYHSQNVERKHLEMRIQALNSNLGLHINTVAEHCQFYQFIINACALKGLPSKLLSSRWIVFCAALKEVQEMEFKNGKQIEIPTVLDIALMDMLENSPYYGVVGLTEDKITDFATLYCPDYTIQNAWHIIAQGRIHRSHIKSSTITGAVWSQKTTVRKMRGQITDDNTPFNCCIKFRSVGNKGDLLEVSNIIISCSNPGCIKTRQNNTNLKGCKHGIALLLQRKQRVVDENNLKKNVTMSLMSSSSSYNTFEIRNFNETTNNEWWSFNRIMSIRKNDEGEEEFLVSWRDKRTACRVRHYKPKDMSWVKGIDMACGGKKSTIDGDYSARDNYENTLNRIKFSCLGRKYAY